MKGLLLWIGLSRTDQSLKNVISEIAFWIRRNKLIWLFKYLLGRKFFNVTSETPINGENCLNKFENILNHIFKVPKSSLARHWKSLDKTLLKPLLTNSQPTLQVSMTHSLFKSFHMAHYPFRDSKLTNAPSKIC